MFEWNKLDCEAEAEGDATKRAFKQPHPRRGTGKSNRSALSRDYRIKRKGTLRRLRVIDGKATL
jgi:hypothetical protein